MNKHLTHVCMVSSQPTPNLTPVLDERTRPERVVLLVSDGMKERAGWLRAVMETYDVRVDQYAIADAYDIEGLRETLTNLAVDLADSGAALNVTGGTKPMAIAAHEVFRELGLPVFYVHPEKDRLIWLFPKREAVDLQDRVKLENYLAVHGYRLDERPDRAPVPKGWRRLTRGIIDGIHRYGGPLGPVNYLAQSAEGRLVSDKIDSRELERKEFRELIDWFEKESLLRLDGDRLRFPDEERRAFVNGGWLEEHVKSVVDGLRHRLGVQDLAQGVKVCKAASCKVRNEIDVAFLADNRLYIVECKTKKFRNPNQLREDDTIYKLDTLKDLGGLNAKAMLVSFRRLRPADEERARAYDIRTVVGTKIQGLEKEITEWLKS